jgi:hypothetical protein
METLLDSARLLGDVAEITVGVIARDHGRRYAAPSAEWQPVLTESSLSPFFVGDERECYRLRRDTVNRVPPTSEYDVPEKVLLSRRRSPLTVALDNTGLPYNGELFGIITVTGLQPAYLAAVLNSRYARFFFNVYRAAAAITAEAGGAGGARSAYFSRFDLEALPIVIAKPREQDAVSALARKISAISPQTRDDEMREFRAQALREIEKQILKIFRFTADEIQALIALPC